MISPATDKHLGELASLVEEIAVNVRALHSHLVVAQSVSTRDASTLNAVRIALHSAHRRAAVALAALGEELPDPAATWPPAPVRVEEPPRPFGTWTDDPHHLRCPLCGVQVKWNAGVDGDGWACCQDGADVSRRDPGVGPACPWRGAGILVDQRTSRTRWAARGPRPEHRFDRLSLDEIVSQAFGERVSGGAP